MPQFIYYIKQYSVANLEKCLFKDSRKIVSDYFLPKLNISFQLIAFPYCNTPRLNIRDAWYVTNTKAAHNTIRELAISQTDTPKGIRNNMATGDVNGKYDRITDICECGALIIKPANKKVTNNGAVIGKVNCCVSVSLSVIAPTAANKDAYNR